MLSKPQLPSIFADLMEVRRFSQSFLLSEALDIGAGLSTKVAGTLDFTLSVLDTEVPFVTADSVLDIPESTLGGKEGGDWESWWLFPPPVEVSVGGKDQSPVGLVELVFLFILLPMVMWTSPCLMPLKAAMASAWEEPASDRPFTVNTSSPAGKIEGKLSFSMADVNMIAANRNTLYKIQYKKRFENWYLLLSSK